jgi:phosphohistidine phosphatase
MAERRIVLVRHAKADRPEGVADIERPLTARGHADAAAIGAWLAHRGYQPDLVICSPSKRTRQTWHGVALALAETAGSGPTVRYEQHMYDGEAQDLLDLVRVADGEANTVLLVGHNPAVSELSALLDPRAVGDSDGLRTSGIAVHALDATDWRACTPGGARLCEAHTARG